MPANCCIAADCAAAAENAEEAVEVVEADEVEEQAAATAGLNDEEAALAKSKLRNSIAGWTPAALGNRLR